MGFCRTSFITFLLCSSVLNVAQTHSPAKPAATWPTGAMGDLVVKAGAVSQFPPGIIYDYRSITIEAGGTLEVLPGEGWTTVGIQGDLVLKGKITARNRLDFGGSFHAIAPDGTILNATVSQQSGGAGGNPGDCGLTHVLPKYLGYGGPAAAAPAAGNGGGGGVYGPGNGGAGNAIKGGDGGTAPRDYPLEDVGQGGNGAPGFAGNGADGQPADGTNTMVEHFGGGGGGGTRGRNGGLLYLHVGGNFDGSGGSIDLSGENGGNGGNGGGGKYAYSASGGGGAAGGSGGILYLNYGTEFSPSQFLYSGGSGGAGGQGGFTSNTGQHACPGANGNNGVQGQVHINAISTSK